jgi:TctA family transporter
MAELQQSVKEMWTEYEILIVLIIISVVFTIMYRMTKRFHFGTYAVQAFAVSGFIGFVIMLVNKWNLITIFHDQPTNVLFWLFIIGTTLTAIAMKGTLIKMKKLDKVM